MQKLDLDWLLTIYLLIVRDRHHVGMGSIRKPQMQQKDLNLLSSTPLRLALVGISETFWEKFLNAA